MEGLATKLVETATSIPLRSAAWIGSSTPWARMSVKSSPRSAARRRARGEAKTRPVRAGANEAPKTTGATIGGVAAASGSILMVDNTATGNVSTFNIAGTGAAMYVGFDASANASLSSSTVQQAIIEVKETAAAASITTFIHASMTERIAIL